MALSRISEKYVDNLMMVQQIHYEQEDVRVKKEVEEYLAHCEDVDGSNDDGILLLCHVDGDNNDGEEIDPSLYEAL